LKWRITCIKIDQIRENEEVCEDEEAAAQKTCATHLRKGFMVYVGTTISFFQAINSSIEKNLEVDSFSTLL